MAKALCAWHSGVPSLRTSGDIPGPKEGHPADAAEAQKGLARKVAFAALFAAVIFAALAFYGDLQALKRAASEFAPSALLLGLTLALLNYGVRILRWQYYLRHLGVRIPLGESAIVFLCGFVMSVTPGKIGEVFKSLLLAETRGIPFARTAPIVIAERLTDLIALVILVAIGSLAFEHGVAFALASAAIVGLLMVVCAYRPLGHMLLRWADKAPLVARISPKLHDAYDALLELNQPAPLLLGSAMALIGWAMECGLLYVIVHGFAGVHLDWDAATFAYSASTIAGAIAMMPGGLGVTEIGMTALLQTLGGESMEPAVATASTILVRIATLWFAVAIGIVALIVHRTVMRSQPAQRPISESTDQRDR